MVRLRKLIGRLQCAISWHAPTFLEPLGYDNCASRCSRCRRRLLWSSQGWFAVGEPKESPDA